MKNGKEDEDSKLALAQAITETHDMADIMETEEESMKTKHVQGSIYGFNGCALFLTFQEEGSEEVQYCLFRAHRYKLGILGIIKRFISNI